MTVTMVFKAIVGLAKAQVAQESDGRPGLPRV